MRGFEWEQDQNRAWWVVEHNGALRTGPFDSKDRAREWFRSELDLELEEKGEAQ